MGPVTVYIGWDGRDAKAYEVARASLLAHTSVPVEVVALKEWELRARGLYRREYEVMADGQKIDKIDGKPFSTDFTFTRHLVSALASYRDTKVVFTDADVMWRADIAELLDAPDKAICCVKHEHWPKESTKALGVQTQYPRKNWSSVMVINPARNTECTVDAVNTRTGLWLQGLSWLDDDEIGGLPERWNWLEGWSPGGVTPNIVHYTRGTPDMVDGLPYADEWWSYV